MSISDGFYLLLVDFSDFHIFVLFSVVRPEDPSFKLHLKVRYASPDHATARSGDASRAGSTAHVAAGGGGAAPVCGRSTPDAANEAAAVRFIPMLPRCLCVSHFWQVIASVSATCRSLPSEVPAQCKEMCASSVLTKYKSS